MFEHFLKQKKKKKKGKERSIIIKDKIIRDMRAIFG